MTRPRQKNGFAFGVYVLLGFLTAGAQEPPTVGAANPISLSVIDAAWEAHLADAIGDPENREWKFRARLERNPLDHEAIMGLVAHFDARREGTLALAALQYAAYGGFATNSLEIKRLVDETARVRKFNEQGKVDSDPFVEVRMEWFKEMLEAGKKRNISLSTYGRMETENRSLIQKSAQQQQLLNALARQYQHHREWSMAVMTAMLALRLDPNNEDMIELCLEILAKPGCERFGELMLAYYAKRNDLTLSHLDRFISWSEARNLKHESFAFYKQAARLDPDNPLRWQKIGETLFAERKYREAVKTLEHAAKLPEHDVSIYRTLAVILHHSGDERNMLYWLQRWRDKVEEDQVVEALMSKPFSAYPKLLGQLE